MKVQHPTIPNVRLDVAASTIDDWRSMGWLVVDPPPRPRPQPKTKALTSTVGAFTVSPDSLGGPRGE